MLTSVLSLLLFPFFTLMTTFWLSFSVISPDNTPSSPTLPGPTLPSLTHPVANNLIATISDSSRAAQQAFFNDLRSLCGQSLTGKTQFLWNNDPNDPFVVNELKAYVRECSDTQIRIPFHIGGDTSRTWIFTMTPEGLQFKHQHLKPDGTPDRITNYGGMASVKGTRSNQFFPADQQTVSLDTAYTTNQWNVVLDLERGTLEYRLTRHQRPRYTGIFTRD